jgi:hypothetical protein
MKIDWTEFKKGFDQEQVKEGAAGGGKLVSEILDGVKNTGSRIWEKIKPLIGRRGVPKSAPDVPTPRAPAPDVPTPRAAPHVPTPRAPAPDVPTPPRPARPSVKPAVAVGGAVAGAGMYEAVKNQIGNTVGQLEGLLGGAPGLLSGLLSGSGASGRPEQSLGYLLPSQHGGVSSLKNPLSVYNPAQPIFKRAGIMDDVADAARKRMVNSVLNEVTKTNPLGVDSPRQQSTSHNSEKEIQLVSEYPEIKEMLKNEENKAYLERLLKEQA